MKKIFSDISSVECFLGVTFLSYSSGISCPSRGLSVGCFLRFCDVQCSLH